MNNSSSANHKTLKATSNGANSRLSHHKSMKLDITQPTPLNFQPPSVITVKTKDTVKGEKKLKMSPTIKLNNNSKQQQQQHQQMQQQHQQLQQQKQQQQQLQQQKQDQQSGKRVEIKEAPLRATGGSIKIQCVDRHFVANRKMEAQQQQQQQQQQQLAQQQQLSQQQQHLKKSRQFKDDATTSKSKDLRSAVVEGFSTTTKAHKEPKQPEKGDAPQRPVRTKNQSHNTKIFFDKYLKFAYDLSTPSGVRQLEEHFFPIDANAVREPARSKANPYAKVLRAACEQGEKPKGSEGFEVQHKS